ncbi:MAG: AI-2E family transporter [Bdellovibrionota bacterium]
MVDSPQPATVPRSSYAAKVLCGLAVVAAMAAAREVLLPFALAILLSFTLAPLAHRLEKLRLGRVPAVITVTLVFFGITSIVGYVIVQQVYDFAVHLPDYKVNIINKARTFHSGEPGVIEKVTQTFKDVSNNLADGSTPIDPEIGPPRPEWLKRKPAIATPEGKKPISSDPRPVPVEIVEHLSAQDIIMTIVGPVLSPLGSFALVMLFVVFILLEREDLRNRLIRLGGPKQLTLTTEALDDAARRVSRYLQMQVAINVSFGVMVSLGLMFIGLPNAFLWGVLACILRFVPYVGPLIATSIPVVLSLAVFDGWRRPMMVFAWFISNELFINNVIEPWLYGVSTGISRIGVLASAVFWGWLWGPIGLVIATPLTVSLTVLGKYVPALSFFLILLSDEEILPPRARFYQRLLAMDSDEAMAIAESYLAESSLEALYDDVIIPALIFAARESKRGLIEPARREALEETLRQILMRLRTTAVDGSGSDQITQTFQNHDDDSQLCVICLPAHDTFDEIAGLMLGHRLEQDRCHVEQLSAKRLASEMLEDIAEGSARIICISSLPPFEMTNAKYLMKRIRARYPEYPVAIGLWQTERDPHRVRHQLGLGPNDVVVRTVAEAADYIGRMRTVTATAKEAAQAPSTEQRASASA